MSMTTWLLLAFAIWYWFVLVNYENTDEFIRKTPLHVAWALVAVPTMFALLFLRLACGYAMYILSFGNVNPDEY